MTEPMTYAEAARHENARLRGIMERMGMADHAQPIVAAEPTQPDPRDGEIGRDAKYIGAIDAGIAALEDEAEAERQKAQSFAWGTKSAASHFARAAIAEADIAILVELRAALVRP